jgi:hypothetical protein
MQQTNDITTKILATENISIIRANVQTASFDVLNRVLTLPVWDVAPVVEDYLKAHEVGHALYTDHEKVVASVEKNECKHVPQAFLNVVEDARIEKLMRRRFPGLARIMLAGNRELLRMEFYGDLNRKLSLLDRINLYFKCGALAPVRFDEKEIYFVKKIESVETIEDMVRVSAQIHKYLSDKKKEEEEKKEQKNTQQGNSPQNNNAPCQSREESDGEYDEDSASSEKESNAGSKNTSPEASEEEREASASRKQNSAEEESSGSNSSGDASDEEVENATENSDNGEEGTRVPSDDSGNKIESNDSGEQEPDEFESKTDQSFADASKKAVRADYTPVLNIHVPALSEYFGPGTTYRDFIIPFQKLDDMLEQESQAFKNHVADAWKQHNESNKSIVQFMLKEFLLKKSANKYSRSRTSKTGVLDIAKLAGYKTTENLFKNVTITSDGDNHSIVILVDWSGSMSDNISNTLTQIINVVSFCRAAGVKYSVMAFTAIGDVGMKRIRSKNNGCLAPNTFSVYNSTYMAVTKNNHVCPIFVTDTMLIELFSDKMSNKEFHKAAGFYLAKYRRAFYRTPYNEIHNNYSEYELCGCTPLNSALLIMREYVRELFKFSNSEKNSLVVISDGCSDDYSVVNENGRYSSSTNNNFVFDNKSYVETESSTSNSMFYMKMLFRNMHEFGINIGYYYISNSVANLQSVFINTFGNTESVDIYTILRQNPYYRTKLSNSIDSFMLVNTNYNNYNRKQKKNTDVLKTANAKNVANLLSKKMNSRIYDKALMKELIRMAS